MKLSCKNCHLPIKIQFCNKCGLHRYCGLHCMIAAKGHSSNGCDHYLTNKSGERTSNKSKRSSWIVGNLKFGSLDRNTQQPVNNNSRDNIPPLRTDSTSTCKKDDKRRSWNNMKTPRLQKRRSMTDLFRQFKNNATGSTLQELADEDNANTSSSDDITDVDQQLQKRLKSLDKFDFEIENQENNEFTLVPHTSGGGIDINKNVGKENLQLERIAEEKCDSASIDITLTDSSGYSSTGVGEFPGDSVFNSGPRITTANITTNNNNSEDKGYPFQEEEEEDDGNLASAGSYSSITSSTPPQSVRHASIDSCMSYKTGNSIFINAYDGAKFDLDYYIGKMF